jgi:putative membrane protein insertion efficiency factor
MRVSDAVLDAVLRAGFALYKRVISPLLHAVGVSQCIFLPTCSEYALVAISRHGWIRGTGLALRRISRCHPWSKGGLDPVP